MTTSTRKPPSYRLHRGSGQAMVQFKGYRSYLGKYGTPESRERYERFLAEVWTRPTPIPAADPSPRGELLIVQLVARYWEFAEGDYRKDGGPSRVTV